MPSTDVDEKQSTQHSTIDSTKYRTTTGPRSDQNSVSLSDTNEKDTKVATSDDDLDPFRHLPEDEAEILRRQVELKKVPVSYKTFYRYATKTDIFILVIGYICSIAAGAGLPMFTLVFGSLTQEFTNFLTEEGSRDQFQSSINHYTLYFLYLGIGIIGLTTIETFIHVDRGEVLAGRIRQHYLKGILRQNIGYFDKLGAGEVTTRITNDTNAIQEGISEKAGLIVSGISTFITAFVIGFTKDWKMTLILSSVVVAIVGDMAIGSTFIVKYTTRATKAYSEGSTVAEETISAIRNTVAFGTQKRLSEKFDVHLYKTMKAAALKGRTLTIMVATIWSVVYMSYALAFWQGSRFIADGSTQVGPLVTVIMAIMIGAFVLGNVAPAFQAIGNAIASGQKIFEAIDRVPVIDNDAEEDENNQMLDGDIQGRIELKDVKFIYPSRPDVTVLANMNLIVEPGQTVALVGASGSGKSTIVGLIERFYDPIKGSIYVDGRDISKIHVRSLRQQIALVSQEPTLFSTTIRENIAYGLIGTQYENASDEKKLELVVEACKFANAWDFIQNLTDGLETHVGERGFLMSGGQKQRIAIARAIISEPKILLLDEATSALDTKSEGVVQDALDRAAKSRTTIVIAHRLSTIKDADKIVVMSKGDIVESGTHEELLKLGGAYSNLVHAQKIVALKSKEAFGDDIEGSPSRQDPDAPAVLTADDDVPLGLTKTSTKKSISSLTLEGKAFEIPVVKRSIIYLFKMIYGFNRKEKYHILTGSFFAIICGVGYPAMAILFAKTMGAFMVTPDHYAQMRHQINMYSGFFFMIGVIEWGSFYLMISNLSYASEHLVRNIRRRVFDQFLRMDIAFYDLDENSSGALVSTLAKDGQYVEGLGGATIGQVLQSVVTLVVGVIIGLVFNWRLALVCTACVPVLVGCGFVRFWVLVKLQERAKKVYEESGSYACESIGSIRTVASLTREQGVFETYKESVERQISNSRPSALRSGFLYGLSQGLTPWVMGLGFWYGSTLMKSGTISSFQFFVAFIAVVFGAQSAGSIFSFAPDMGKAKQAAENISRILDVEPEIDTWSDEGEALDHNTVKGDIEFVDVHFRYPTRPNVPVLRGLNLTIKSGQYVALVGSSGCGKSTTIGLVESFYRPISGQVLLDGHDIKSLNINAYRSHLALVQQEPILYSGSIRENILLGTDKDVSEEDMYEACRKSNIHDFITSLPDGYETFCGSKGALLSGGQKQRIAIARALIRNPKVLLLDEATSALDSESEKVVQHALDKAAKGRTTIAVAHRLSTIQNADIIYVIDNGRVLESGSHQELLANKSKYYELVQMQALEK